MLFILKQLTIFGKRVKVWNTNLKTMKEECVSNVEPTSTEERTRNSVVWNARIPTTTEGIEKYVCTRQR